MIILILFSMIQPSFAEKAADLETLHRICSNQGVEGLKKIGIEKKQLDQFCDCVKKEMDSEFSKKGDEEYLNMIVHSESATTKEDQKRAEKRLDEAEGAYVFMDLYLDIRKECASELKPKNSKKK